MATRRPSRSARARAASGPASRRRLHAAAGHGIASWAAARRPFQSARGQASVELVVLLPVIAAVALGAWQVAVAGHAVWAAGAAARAGARAKAVGGDADRAARRLLPAAARREAKVVGEVDGEVRVVVPIPAVVGRGSLFTTAARARFEPQR